jgi:nitrite reductase (NADH) small subunit/3-phenylpropionate/trans-cinnamate dioxygenase ferredoxin subunit
MLEYHHVCRADELPEGGATTVVVRRKLIAVFRDRGGYFAIDDVCPHMGASLAGGCVEDGVVTCPWHAWRFRLADGAWADNPRIKIGRYPVRLAGDDIQVGVEAGPTPPPEEKPP